MRRLLLNFLTGLSLLLLIGATTSLVLSYVIRAAPLDDLPARTAGFEHSQGRLRVVVPSGREAATGATLIPLPAKKLADGEGSSWSVRGTVTLSKGRNRFVFRDVDLEETSTRRWLRAATMDEVSVGARLAGCAWSTGRRSIGRVDTDATPGATFQRWAALTVPHAYLLVAFALLPVWRGTQAFRQRRRDRAGLCARCGYDIRATPHRCPECGTPAAG